MEGFLFACILGMSKGARGGDHGVGKPCSQQESSQEAGWVLVQDIAAARTEVAKRERTSG